MGDDDRRGGGPGTAEMPVPEAMLREGGVLQRTQSRYTTAVHVQKPRNLDQIVKNLEAEAEYAGKEWFYHWIVESHDQRTGEVKVDIVEGGSINMAYALAREMGNCAVECDDVRHIGNATYFFPCFIDLEKGTTIQRPFRASNVGEVHGRYKEARKADMRFQIAVSKAERNVIFAGTYKWIEKRLIKKAQEVVAKKITAEGIEKHKLRAIQAFEELSVTEEMLVKRIGKPVVQWSVEDVVTLSGFMQAIKTAEALVSDLFPAVNKERTGKGEVDLDAAMTPEKVDDPKDTPAEPGDDGGDEPRVDAPTDKSKNGPSKKTKEVPDAPDPGPADAGSQPRTGNGGPDNPLFPPPS